MAALGMNLARVPFNYRLLEEPDGFAWLDRAIKWAKAHGVYVLLDRHAAPGGQNEAEHGGERGSNRLFHNARPRCNDAPSPDARRTGHLLVFLPALARACGDDLKHMLFGEVYAFADASQLPPQDVALIEREWGDVAAFNELWYCVWASHFAMKSCDFYWSEMREMHDQRFGIPTAMHPGNLPLLIEYSPSFKEATKGLAL